MAGWHATGSSALSGCSWPSLRSSDSSGAATRPLADCSHCWLRRYLAQLQLRGHGGEHKQADATTWLAGTLATGSAAGIGCKGFACRKSPMIACSCRLSCPQHTRCQIVSTNSTRPAPPPRQHHSRLKQVLQLLQQRWMLELMCSPLVTTQPFQHPHKPRPCQVCGLGYHTASSLHSFVHLELKEAGSISESIL
jgi:hypothetical protein